MSDNTLLWTLLAANFLLVAVLVCRHCISRAGIEVNHVLTLSIGFVAYWLTPFPICMLGLFSDFGETSVGYAFFNSIPYTTRELYLTFCLLTYGAFALGTEICGRSHKTRRVYQPIRFPLVYLDVYLGAFGLIALVLAYGVRSAIGNGYLTIGPDEILGRSVFTSATSNLLVLAFLYSLKREEILRQKMGEDAPTFKQVIRNPAVIIYAIAALLLLSTGQRLMVLASFIMFLVYSTVYFKRLRVRTAAVTMGSLFVLAGAIGVVRVGGKISAKLLLFFLFYEITDTSKTLFAFLKAGRLEWFNYPTYLINSLINLIPRPLFPSKGDYLVSPAQDGYVIYNPQGSFHSFVQFCINFGLIGTVLVWFCIGYGLQRLKKKGTTLLHRAAYILIAGYLMTTFFRDGFSQSIAKAFVEFSLLMPFLIILSLNKLLNYLHPPLPPPQQPVLN